MTDKLISNINRTTSLDSRHTFACMRRAQVSLTLELLNVFHRTTSCPLHYDCVHEEKRGQRNTRWVSCVSNKIIMKLESIMKKRDFQIIRNVNKLFDSIS